MTGESVGRNGVSLAERVPTTLVVTGQGGLRGVDPSLTLTRARPKTRTSGGQGDAGGRPWTFPQCPLRVDRLLHRPLQAEVFHREEPHRKPAEVVHHLEEPQLKDSVPSSPEWCPRVPDGWVGMGTGRGSGP